MRGMEYFNIEGVKICLEFNFFYCDRLKNSVYNILCMLSANRLSRMHVQLQIVLNKPFDILFDDTEGHKIFYLY